VLLCVEINNAEFLFEEGRSGVTISLLDVTPRDRGGDVERNASTVINVAKTKKLVPMFVLMKVMERNRQKRKSGY